MHFKLFTVGCITATYMTSQAQAQQVETTRLLVELCRHGARTSSQIFPLTVNDPYDNFQTPQILTQTGAEMHYNLGSKYIRTNYIER
jgi:hypothetical protein